MKLDRMNAVNMYMFENCTSDGSIKDSGILTPEEEDGRKEILEGVKTKNWLVYNSDKSGSIVLDTKENYLEAMKEYYQKDPVISLDEVREIEKLFNNHTRAWSKIFGIGDSIGQRRRCTRALISSYVTIPVLQGLRKDHKPSWYNDPNQFYPAQHEPTKEQISKLIGHAVGVGTEVCMDNHVYTIKGYVRKQKEGGTKGADLTERMQDYICLGGNN